MTIAVDWDIKHQFKQTQFSNISSEIAGPNKAKLHIPEYSDIFSKTTWPIKAKLYVEHGYERGIKVYINGHGHMTKMAVMAINSKNL